MEYGEKIELMRSEVRRLLKEYEDCEVGWWEMASNIHLDPRLDLEAQVNVYAQVSKEIDGDEVKRFTTIDDEEEYVETYGVDMDGAVADFLEQKARQEERARQNKLAEEQAIAQKKEQEEYAEYLWLKEKLRSQP